MNGIRHSYTAHPVMVLHYLKPFLFVLLLPLLKALIGALMKRQVNGLVLNELIISVVIIVYTTIKWKTVKITVSDTSVQIASGLLFRRFTEIPVEKISTIETIRYISDRIFGSVTLRINTEAGRKGKADCEIKLSRHDAEQIRTTLSKIETARTLKFSAVRVAVMAATASSAFTGLVFTVPIIKKAGDLLGTAIEEILLARINAVSEATNRFLPPIINTVTIVFVALYTVSFLISFFRCVNFHLRLGPEKMEIANGLITRRTITFKTKTVNSVLIEQTPLMRFFKRYLVRVSVGGYGDNRGNKAVVVPSAKKAEVNDLFCVLFPNVETSKRLIRPKLSSRHRFYFIPTIFLIISVAAYFVFSKLFPVFKALLAFAFIISVVILIYYYNLAAYNVKNSVISVSRILYAKYTRWSATREMYCEADRVGVIRITQWPADRKYGTCNIRLTVRSENAESITVKHINYNEIKTELCNFYNFE